MNIREILAANIRRMRAKRGMSQEDLADLADIDRTYLSRVERRIYAASIDKVASIAQALKVEPHELLKPAASVDPETPDLGAWRINER